MNQLLQMAWELIKTLEGVDWTSTDWLKEVFKFIIRSVICLLVGIVAFLVGVLIFLLLHEAIQNPYMALNVIGVVVFFYGIGHVVVKLTIGLPSDLL